MIVILEMTQRKKIRDDVSKRIKWKTKLFKEKAELLIQGANTGLQPNGIMTIGYGFEITGVKPYPYKINGYFESDTGLVFTNSEGKYSSEIYASSIEKMIEDFLSYLYTLEKQVISEQNM